MIRHWLPPFLQALAVGAVFLLLPAWLVPGLVDSTVLTDRMLQASYQLPELVSSYVPDLLLGVRLSLVAGASAALGCFAAWAVAMLLLRPAGPAEVGRSWRRVLWSVLAFVAAVIAYAATSVGLLGRLDTVDGAAATRLAVAIAAAAPFAFWVLSLIGAERMMLPAVPGGTVVRGRA